MNNLFNMIFGNMGKKKVPLSIIANDDALVFLVKQLEVSKKQRLKQIEEIEKEIKNDSKRIWDSITQHLFNNGTIENKNVELYYDDGVVYKIVDED